MRIKNRLFTVMFIIIITCFSCTEKKKVEYYDSEETRVFREFTLTNDGKMEGKYFEYYENGNKSIECTYHKDKLIGDFIYYYENGTTKYQVVYKNGVMWNIKLYQSQEGKRYDYGDFKNGNGNVLVYSNSENHSLINKCWYRNGLLNDYKYKYRPDGQVDSLLYIEGKLFGKGKIQYFPPF